MIPAPFPWGYVSLVIGSLLTFPLLWVLEETGGKSVLRKLVPRCPWVNWVGSHMPEPWQKRLLLWNSYLRFRKCAERGESRAGLIWVVALTKSCVTLRCCYRTPRAWTGMVALDHTCIWTGGASVFAKNGAVTWSDVLSRTDFLLCFVFGWSGPYHRARFVLRPLQQDTFWGPCQGALGGVAWWCKHALV